MNFGAFVASRENDVVGTVERVVLDPSTNEVLEYVVHLTLDAKRDVVVPIAAVLEMDDELVLNLSSSEVERLPDYLSKREAAELESLGFSPFTVEAIELSNHTRIRCIDGEVGTLEGVVTDEFTAEITDLIVRVGRDGRRAVVPLAWASSLRGDLVELQCAKSEI